MLPQISQLANANLSGNHFISKPSDIKYLLGMEDSQGIEILVKNHVIHILVDDLIAGEIGERFDRYNIVNIKHKRQMRNLFSNIKILKVDQVSTTLSQKKRLEKFGAKDVRGAKGIVSPLRTIKIPEEIETIRKSQEINLQTLESVLSKISLGISEFEIANLIKMKHFELGASGESFEPIAAFSEGGAVPHHTNSYERKLVRGDQILIDMGCIYDGYCSDMTRVIFANTPSDEQKRWYHLLKQVSRECIQFGKIGMEYRDLHAKARELLGEYKKNFTHNLGHGIGRDIHEMPLGMGGLKDTIQENQVFTIEPGLYFPGKYGFRYENIVVATKNGLVDILGDQEEKDYILDL